MSVPPDIPVDVTPPTAEAIPVDVTPPTAEDDATAIVKALKEMLNEIKGQHTLLLDIHTLINAQFTGAVARFRDSLSMIKTLEVLLGDKLTRVESELVQLEVRRARESALADLRLTEIFAAQVAECAQCAARVIAGSGKGPVDAR